MFGQLGLITFRMMKQPTKMSSGQAITFAKHPVIRGKTKLQYTGQEPKTYSLEVRLHASFCDVDAELMKIEANALLSTSGLAYMESLPFFLGSGKFLGNYVITNVARTYEETFPDGRLLEVIVALTLEEYTLDEAINGILDLIS